MGSWSYIQLYPNPVSGFQLREMVAFLIKSGCAVDGGAPRWLQDLMAGKGQFEDLEEPALGESDVNDAIDNAGLRETYDVTLTFEGHWFVTGFGHSQLRPHLTFGWPDYFYQWDFDCTSRMEMLLREAAAVGGAAYFVEHFEAHGEFGERFSVVDGKPVLDFPDGDKARYLACIKAIWVRRANGLQGLFEHTFEPLPFSVEQKKEKRGSGQRGRRGQLRMIGMHRPGKKSK
ncbi:MAG: hypothetical protein IPK82_06070 [Polyangiaceae bacterium]|nr:hypothetical protein [Polyangiaceae bacterium]